ncbi:hypothetical protein [Streptomyces sp. NPDC059991]|uniref:hypothetical protein n=1 Tax=unclassified Streptomyces TaxID=2593676 RepID=UPI0036C7DBB0
MEHLRARGPAAFASSRGSVCIAWTGTDGAGHLNVVPVSPAAVRAGADPIGAVYTRPETRIAAPALVPQMDWKHGRHRLAVFWTGTDGSGALNGCEVVLPCWPPAAQCAFSRPSSDGYGT